MKSRLKWVIIITGMGVERMTKRIRYYCKNCGKPIGLTDTVCLNCGSDLREVGRRIVVTLLEGIMLSDSVETSLIINPKPEIEKSLEEQDYFKATTLLSAILEYYGKQIIIERLRAKGREVDKERVDRLHLSDVTLFLYGLEIINQSCYSALIELNKLRNNFMHIKNLVEFRRKYGKDAETTIRRAMQCLDAFLAHQP